MHKQLVENIRRTLGQEIDIEPEGLERFIIYTPFMFADGDHFVVILKRGGDKWVITDEGHTLMHFSDDGLNVLLDDFFRGHAVASVDGVLSIDVVDDEFGDAVSAFLAGLHLITMLHKNHLLVTQLEEELRRRPGDTSLQLDLGSLLKHRRKMLATNPPDDELPTLHDVRALGRWDTGGLDSVAFIRSLRDRQGD